MRAKSNVWVGLVLMTVLTGCASSREQEMYDPSVFPPGIPKSAALIQMNSGRQFYQPVVPGRAYVYDADTSTVVFTVHVDPQQRLYIEPKRGTISIEAKVVYEAGLNNEHTYRIYFDPADQSTTTQPGNKSK